MKVVILAGGLGSRIFEESNNKPKAMVRIGEQPILWHIMKYYSHFGFNEFVIALGYKGECITQWMLQQARVLNSEKMPTNESCTLEVPVDNRDSQKWKVHLVDTGQKTQNGGRIKRLAPLLSDQTFMLTWCDGLADINLQSLLNFHNTHNRLATVTAVRPPSRFGHLVLKGDRVLRFNEKPRLNWINGAFFVLEPEVLDYIKDDETRWEKEPLEKLANDGQLTAYRHDGFWQCMDTLPEKQLLEKLWYNGKAPWKKW
jgi:glucose-1-phosphate cytidylyltransferase